MCATCGCEAGAKTTLLNLQTGTTAPIGIADLSHARNPHTHVHADGSRHSHAHEGDHTHEDHDEAGHRNAPADHVHVIEARILAKNDVSAGKTRAWLNGREILAVNLLSAPGSGKTTVLERTIAGLRDQLPLYVIEGDQASANDGERIRNAGAPVVQINTGTGCHLDADMVARGLSELKPGPGSVVFIENVGNLVCPALFDLGERVKVVLFSVTEGEDKPLKYPHMFRAASIVLISKIDLVPHLDFSLDEAIANVRLVNPDAPILQLSARSGEGFAHWLDWVRAEAAAVREFTPL